jgi:zinc transport system substrate-binding protein
MKKSVILMFITAILSGCSIKEKPDSKIEIAVSILPQEYFVSNIAGDLFKINVMIPPGASPATYEPTPAQMASLSKTDLYFKMGHTGFERAWMDKLSSANDKMSIIDLSEGIQLIREHLSHQSGHHQHGHEGGVDPHTWLSPKNVKIISKTIHEALKAHYPEHSEIFDKNLSKFLNDLDSLDNYISTSLSDLNSRSFFTYHPSLSYFARDYNLDQHPLELEGKTPSSSHMKYLIDTGIENKIKVIFLQMQFDQKNAEVLANETGAEIVQINPLDPEWHKQMLFITQKLKEKL